MFLNLNVNTLFEQTNTKNKKIKNQKKKRVSWTNGKKLSQAKPSNK